MSKGDDEKAITEYISTLIVLMILKFIIAGATKRASDGRLTYRQSYRLWSLLTYAAYFIGRNFKAGQLQASKSYDNSQDMTQIIENWVKERAEAEKVMR